MVLLDSRGFKAIFAKDPVHLMPTNRLSAKNKINAKAMFLVTLAACLTGCKPAPRPRSETTPVSSPPGQNAANPHSPATRQAVSTITEITIQYNPGINLKSPMYTLTLRSDGTAICFGAAFSHSNGTYKATIPAALSHSDGTYKATIPPAEFQRLAHLLEAKGFFSLAGYYGPRGAIDSSFVCISVVQGKQRKTVKDTGKAMHPSRGADVPNEFKEIGTAINAAVSGAQWVKTSDAVRQPYLLPGITDSH